MCQKAEVRKNCEYKSQKFIKELNKKITKSKLNANNMISCGWLQILNRWRRCAAGSIAASQLQGQQVNPYWTWMYELVSNWSNLFTVFATSHF